jgi:hypothetical protein
LDESIAKHTSKNEAVSPLELLFSARFSHWGDVYSAHVHRLKVIDPEWLYDWLSGASKQAVESLHLKDEEVMTRSHLSLWLGSHGSMESIENQISGLEEMGRKWVEPLLKGGKVQWHSSSKSPYPGVQVLEIK